MSVLNSLIEDAAKLATRATDIGTHQRALTSKLGKQIEEEGVEAINKKLPDVLGGVHKEMKGQGWNMVDYASDVHVGHEIEGMAARRVEGFSGTRATWQHPETGSMAEFDMSRMEYNGGRPLGASNPSLQLPGSRASEELYAAGKQRQKEGYAALRELDAAGNASMQAVLDRRKAPAQSPTVAAANAPQAAAPQAPSPSSPAQPPVPAAEPAVVPGKGKNKGKGKKGGGKPAAPAAPSVAQGSPVSAQQVAPATINTPTQEQLDAAAARHKANNPGIYHESTVPKKTYEAPTVSPTGSTKRPYQRPTVSSTGPIHTYSRTPEQKWSEGHTREANYPGKRPSSKRPYEKPAVSSTGPAAVSTYPRRSYERPSARKTDSRSFSGERHWGKDKKSLLAGMAIDAVGMPLIGALLGGIKAGYDYDPEQEQNDRYRGTNVIGRGNAIVQGAMSGAGYGAAAALGTGTMKGVGRLFGTGAYAHGGSVLGSFARGVRTGYKGAGDSSWTHTVGTSLAGESAIAADVMHKGAISEVDRIAKARGVRPSDVTEASSAAAVGEKFFGDMLSDAAKATPGADDAVDLERALSRQAQRGPVPAGGGKNITFGGKHYINRTGTGGRGVFSPYSTAERLRYGDGNTAARRIDESLPSRPSAPFSQREGKGGLVGGQAFGATLSSLPNMIGNALGIAVGTVPMSIGKVDDWYGESVAPGANVLPWKRKWGKDAISDWKNTHFGMTENPYFDATKEASHALNPFGKNKQTTWNGQQTTAQIGAWGLVGGGIIANSAYSMMEDSSYAGPSTHPINAIFNRPDRAVTARAQAEADAAEKVRMTDPKSLGLSDIEENYYSNPNLRPVKKGHAPGQYNDSGDLVFALSALRRG